MVFTLSDSLGLFAWMDAFKAQQVSNTSKTAKRKNLKKESGEENPEEYVDPETPFGEKKHLSQQMAKQFNPNAVEKS